MNQDIKKQYGLIIPSKKKTALPVTRKLNPLLDSDEELEKDEEEPINWVEASLKKSVGNAGQHALQKRMLREAFSEDPSVFHYDEVYDKIQETKDAAEEAKRKNIDRKPRYIHNIIKQSKKRKLEQEIQNEHKIQKEREAEGDEFADKEVFITSAYKKKLEERKKMIEEAQLEQLREEKLDVMKHKNFGVFYSHLLDQKAGPSTKDKREENVVKIKKEEQE